MCLIERGKTLFHLSPTDCAIQCEAYPIGLSWPCLHCYLLIPSANTNHQLLLLFAYWLPTFLCLSLQVVACFITPCPPPLMSRFAPPTRPSHVVSRSPFFQAYVTWYSMTNFFFPLCCLIFCYAREAIQVHGGGWMGLMRHGLSKSCPSIRVVTIHIICL